MYKIGLIFLFFSVSSTVVDGAQATLGELSEPSLQISNPQDVILSRGKSNQVLRCHTKSSEAGSRPIIKWLGPIANNTPNIIMRDDLLIFDKPIKQSYAGEYRCLVENKDGKLLSSNAKVQLAGKYKKYSQKYKSPNTYWCM